MTRSPCFANCGNPMCIKGGCQRAAFDNAWDETTGEGAFRGTLVLMSRRQERKYKKIQTSTVCSTMTRCHRRAKITNDPARPPFCNRCKRKSKKNQGFKRKSRAERRKIKLGT